MLWTELRIDAHAELGRGPPWDVTEQRIYLIDSFDRKIRSGDAERDAARSWSIPEQIGSMALRSRREWGKAEGARSRRPIAVLRLGARTA
jgi:sugar lactone lactonase YvrE